MASPDLTWLAVVPFDGSFREQDKVDVVKMTMQDNIQQMLANEERLDQISENAENLNEQVRGIFQCFSCHRDTRRKCVHITTLTSRVCRAVLVHPYLPLVR